MLVCGCASLPDAGKPRKPGLDDEDLALAKALSHYARGLLVESVEGQGAPDALAEFETAARLDPDAERLHARMAASALHAGELDRAIDSLQTLRSLNPTSVAVRVDLAAVYQYAEKPDRAAATYGEAVALDPSRTLTYWGAARSMVSVGRDADALRFIRQGLGEADEPKVLLAYLRALSVQLVRARDIGRAIPFLRMLSSNVDERAAALVLLAEAYMTRNDREEAERILSEALPLPSATVNVFLRLGMLQLERSPGTAAETLSAGRERFPEDRRIHFLRAYALLLADRLEDAVAAFAELGERFGDKAEEDALSADYYQLYANACERLGRQAEAERIMADCLERHPDTAEALNYLAYTWAERGERLDDAHTYVVRALEVDPDNGAYVDTLGWVFYQKQQYVKALEQLQRADVLLDDDPTVIDHLGDALDALGKTQRAVKQWRRSLAVDPAQEAVREKLEQRGVDVDAWLKEPAGTADDDGAAGNGE